MNILLISPFLPYPLDQGGKIRVFNLVKQLSRTHDITLACLTDRDDADPGPLTEFCDEVLAVTRPATFVRDFARFLLQGDAFNCARFHSDSFAAELTQLSLRKRFDLVQIEFSMLWQYARLFPGVPVALDAHNIEFRNVEQIGKATSAILKRLLYRLETARLRAVEEQAWRQCDLCFTVSEQERDLIASLCGNPAKVIAAANGVDPDRFPFRPRERGGKRILFLGGMDYSPNLDAAGYFLRDVFPLIRERESEARLLLVGRELARLGTALSQPGVECHENVPEVLPWFYEADLLVVPLRQGAGTRIKVLEAFAAGLPVVATSKGCEGIAARNGEHLLVAADARGLAQSAARLMEDPELGRRLARSARQLVLESYTWQRAAAVVDDAVRQFSKY